MKLGLARQRRTVPDKPTQAAFFNIARAIESLSEMALFVAGLRLGCVSIRRFDRDLLLKVV